MLEAAALIVADELALLVNDADGVGSGDAGNNVVVDKGGLLGGAHALPRGFALEEHGVSLGALDGIPAQLDAVVGVFRLLDGGRADVGGFPAVSVVAADEISVLVDAADGVGIGAARVDVVVNRGGASGCREAYPAASAEVVDAVGVGALAGVPRQLDAFRGALGRGDLRGCDIGALDALLVVAADEAGAFLVDAADGVGVGIARGDVVVDEAGLGGVAHASPLTARALVEHAELGAALGRFP